MFVPQAYQSSPGNPGDLIKISLNWRYMESPNRILPIQANTRRLSTRLGATTRFTARILCHHRDDRDSLSDWLRRKREAAEVEEPGVLASVGMGRVGEADCQSTVSNSDIPLEIISS